MHGEKNRPEQCRLAAFGELPVAAMENGKSMLPSRAVVSPSVGPLLSLHDSAISRLGSDRGDLRFASL